MSVLTGCTLETNFWFQIRLTEVQRLSVKSKTKEKVGGFFFLKLKQLLIFYNDIGFQVAEDGGETDWSTLQDPVPEENSTMLIIPLQLLCLLRRFCFSILLLPPVFLPAPSFLGTITFIGSFSQGAARTSFLPGLSDKIYALSTSLAPIKQLNLLVV